MRRSATGVLEGGAKHAKKSSLQKAQQIVIVKDDGLDAVAHEHIDIHVHEEQRHHPNPDGHGGGGSKRPSVEVTDHY